MKYISILFLTLIYLFHNVNYCSAALKCIECKSEDKLCSTNPDDLKPEFIKDCEGNKQCYTRLDEKGQIERGCNEANFCKEEKNCKQCADSSGDKPCNNKPIPDDRPKCYVCDDCIKIDGKKPEYCQYYSKDAKNHCFTKTADGKVNRGCFAETINCDETTCTKCLNSNKDESCNNHNLETKLSCYKCGIDNKLCSTNPENLENKDIIECTTGKQCFTKLGEEGQIERGCAIANFCIGKENCKQCADSSGDKPCNNKPIPDDRPKCYVCDDCIKIDGKKPEYCQYYSKDAKNHCFTKTADGKVNRGCFAETIKCDESTCTKCLNTNKDESCNSKSIETKLSCYKCGIDNKLCSTNPENLGKDNIIECTTVGNQCFTKLDEKGQIERGCDEAKFCDGKENCKQCADSSGDKPCNNKPIPDDRPKCYVCDDCIKIDGKKPEYCQYYNKDAKSHCFTKTTDDKVNRGCFTETIKCDDTDTTCIKCSNTNKDETCNNLDYGVLSCYECRSDGNKNCINDIKKVPAITCKTLKGCYTENYNGLIMRSCAEILDDDEFKTCEKTSPSGKNCVICKTKNCNSKFINGAITVNSISSILLIASIFFVCKILN